MYSWNDPDDRVAIVQMNADLRHAQLELLSAQCATDRLRLRYSPGDLARYSEKDLLRKAIGAATAISDYYHSIQSELPEEPHRLTGSEVQRAVKLVADYLWSQRKAYFGRGTPLSDRQKDALRPFFSSMILNKVRTVELEGGRVSLPPFYPEARARGIENLPELTHMTSLTFVDVIVFNDLIVQRALFHGLVHTVQFEILGLERYTDLFVRAFLRTRAHFMVPLETHTFALESKFAVAPEQVFSVEEQVRLWIREGRY
jgi:hypothetical protein